jgi:acetyl-CoA C-acetyltransferase
LNDNIDPRTPVIIGVGQFTERVDAPDYRGLPPYAVAAEAAKAAFGDALSTDPAEALAALGQQVDAIASTRTFEDAASGPGPFGRSNNYPRSIAKCLGINPRLAIWETSSGDSPQRLVNEFCQRIATGELGMALLVGGEAMSSMRKLHAEGKTPDWTDSPGGSVEDRGHRVKRVRYQVMHRIVGGPPGYALLENARRARRNQTREDYERDMGQLFAPFTEVAAANPYASSKQQRYSAEELFAVNERNRMITSPYPRLVVARDQVNQGASLLIASIETARKLGVAESKWVFLHGHAQAHDRALLERADLGASPAAQQVAEAALISAGLGVADMAFFDFYSCFPIAVSNVACDRFGLAPDDPRKLTVTGGLPFFGGPGNNYSMHAVASMVEKLRANPGRFGFVGANGGILTKYAAGVYSTRAAPLRRFDSRHIQAAIDALPAPALAHEPDGWGRIETYTLVHDKGQATHAIVIGRLEATGERFIANSFDGDRRTLEQMQRDDPLGARIYVQFTPPGNRFCFSLDEVLALNPPKPKVLRGDYAFVQAERDGHLLVVTINRPEARNCLHPPAHYELDEIWDAFEADPDLWAAILTGAGTTSFCAGADLKYMAEQAKLGKPVQNPKTGFGALVRRKRSKPLIAAVNGYAMGGGTELCLASDLVVADETAQFALSEVRVGVIAGAGGVIRLPRQIPVKIANELIYTGRKMGVREAEKYGFVNRVAPAGQALEEARKLAAEILEASPTSVRLSMQMRAQSARHASEQDAMADYYDAVDELLSSEDYLEGPRAFAQKRKPQWKNR